MLGGERRREEEAGNGDAQDHEAYVDEAEYENPVTLRHMMILFRGTSRFCHEEKNCLRRCSLSSSGSLRNRDITTSLVSVREQRTLTD